MPLPNIAAAPNTSKIFVMLDPTAFPITTSEVPEYTDTIEVANSGNEVPKATMVTPTTNEGIPNAKPTFSEESTNLSEAINKTVMLTKKIMIGTINANDFNYLIRIQM